MTAQPRRPAGTPTGGQYAESARAEPDVALAPTEPLGDARARWLSALTASKEARWQATLAEARFTGLALRSVMPDADCLVVGLETDEESGMQWSILSTLDGQGRALTPPGDTFVIDGTFHGSLSEECERLSTTFMDPGAWDDYDGYRIFSLDALISGEADGGGWSCVPVEELNVGDRVVVQGQNGEIIQAGGNVVWRDDRGNEDLLTEDVDVVALRPS